MDGTHARLALYCSLNLAQEVQCQPKLSLPGELSEKLVIHKACDLGFLPAGT